MKHKIFIKGIVFVTLFVFLAFLIHGILINGLRLRKTGDYGVWNKLVDGRINTDILLLGASRTLVGLDCNTFIKLTRLKCFNIGMDGATINLQYPILKTYLKYNSKPEIIVQGLSISSFQISEGIFVPNQYIPYLNEKPLYEALLSVDSNFLKHKYLPLYSFAQFKVSIFGSIKGLLGAENIKKDHRINGSSLQNASWTTDFKKFKEKFPKGRKYQIDKKAVQILKNIFKTINSYGIKVVMLYSPEYHENQKVTLNRDEIFNQFRAISNEFNIPFWDYSESKISRDKKYFYNSQHLNAKGAVEFSKQLAEKLIDKQF